MSLFKQEEVMIIQRNFFYFVILLTILFKSSCVAIIHPSAFTGVTQFFNKGMESYSPTFGAVAIESGLIEKLRFYGPFERGKEPKMDKSSDPLWKITKILFPSVNGQVGTVTGAITNFGRYVKNPKTVALLLNYVKQIEDIKGRGNISADITRQYASAIFDTLEKIEEGEGKISNFRKTLSVFLTAIRESVLSEKKGTSFYPRYTTQQVILAFFCYQFNTQEEIWELLKNLDPSIVNKTKDLPTQVRYLEEGDIKNILKKERLDVDELFNLMNSYLFDSPLPYKADINLLNNGTANFYDRKRNVYSKDNKFQDCVETTMRHICNLLTFDSSNRVFNLDYIKDFVANKELIRDIKNSYSPNFLKFYEHQNVLMSNAGNIQIRSLWNSVVAGLPKTIYIEGENEIKSGFVNFLNTFDALFDLSLDPLPDAGFEAKEEWVIDSLNTLFTALNSTFVYKVDFEGEELGNELIGKASVTVLDLRNFQPLFSFKLWVKSSHTEITELKNLKDQQTDESFKYEKFNNNVGVLKAGTAQESLLLLAPFDEERRTHPFYQLYYFPLADNAGRISFLRSLERKYKSWQQYPGWSNNLSYFPLIVKNVLNSIGWEDPHILQLGSPIILKLLNKPDFENMIKDEVHSLKLVMQNWEEVESIVKKLLQLKTLLIKGNVIISGPINLTKIFQEIEYLDASAHGVEEIKALESLPNLKTLVIKDVQNLQQLSVEKLDFLKTLVVSGAFQLETVEGLENLKDLQHLDLSNLMSLKQLSVKNLNSLQTLKLWRSGIEVLEDLDSISNLHLLDLTLSPAIKELTFKHDMKGLTLKLANSGIQNRSQIKGIEHLDESKIDWGN